MIPRDDLVERATLAYGRVVRIIDPIRFQLWAEKGLTMPQVKVLFSLAEAGECSAGEMAETLDVAPPTITGLTDRLVKTGLIERREDPRDRRVVRLALTEAGRTLTSSIAEKARAYLREVFEVLPDGRIEDVCSALEDLADANDMLRTRTAVTS